MSGKPVKIIALLLLFVAFLLSSPVLAAPRRIVSLSPVGTEILYMLNQGGNVVGVTDFCDYPPEARRVPKVGGFTGISLENLISMTPDLVVLQDIHEELASKLSGLGVPYVMAKQESVEDVYRSILAVGAACSVGELAERRAADIKSSIALIAEKTASLPKRSVLLCVSREPGEPRISAFFAAGGKTFYDELIALAGGENVLKNASAAYPKISAEGLVSLDPEVVIDLAGDGAYYHSSGNIDRDALFAEERLRGQWLSGPKVRAVRGGRVSVLCGTVYLRPGPRIPEILKAFAAAIHPEAEL